uniref:Uncharacterized protein n=1 Tax=Cacopsylla melanoneura TaxID=428564 RepID=A0A8D8Y0C5_9HEMI
MNAKEFHEHMQKHLANKDINVDESGTEGVDENIETTYSAKATSPSDRATVSNQQNYNNDNKPFDFTKKQEFRLDTNENEDSSEEAESITPNFVGITRKLIDCHMCSATGMTADQFYNHMLKHQAKAGFAVDSSAIEEEQNKRFGDPMESKDQKKTTHLFSRESSDFSYVDRMLETNEFKKIIKAERKRADISHSYDDRLDPDDSTEFNNSTETTSKTKKRQKRAYEILSAGSYNL